MRTVVEYEAKFTKLSRFVPYIIVYDETRARKFLRGLRLGIRTRLTSFMLTRYANIVNRVLVIEYDCDDFQKVKEQEKRQRPFEP